MSIQIRMAIKHSTPIPRRFEGSVSVRYETRVFSLMKLNRYRSGSTGGVSCAPSASWLEELVA